MGLTPIGTNSGQASRLGVAGNYSLRFQIGEQDISVTPESFSSIDIIEYIDRMLPAFTVTFKDTMGILTHRTLLDSSFNTVTITFRIGEKYTFTERTMKFRIYRRAPEMRTNIADEITINGLLDVPNAFSPHIQRGWEKVAVGSIVREIGAGMGIGQYSIDPSAIRPITIVQPNWNNAMFLQYLADRAPYGSGDTGYFAFVNVTDKGDVRLNFRSITSLLKQPKLLTLRYGQAPDGSILPIYNFEGVDNFEVLGVLGIDAQRYSNFNWTTGVQTDDEITIDEANFQSLSKYYAYDPDIGTEGISQNELGRTHELVPDWKPVLRGRYYKKINSLVKQWVTTAGNTNVRCGSIVKVVFLENPGQLMNYQYTGFWMVERVVHHLASTYITKLLLTRPGIDSETAIGTTLKKARYIKQDGGVYA